MEKSARKVKNRFSFLLNPKVILVAMVAGILNGIFFKTFALSLEPLGSLFLASIQMCLIPILICAVSSNIAKMLNNHAMSHYLTSFLKFAGLGLLATSFLGSTLAIVSQVGDTLSPSARATLGGLLFSSDHQDAARFGGASILNFAKDMVPSNVFSAISTGQNLPIVIFSIIFGISLGFAKHGGVKTVFQITETLLETFLRIINGTMYALPFGLFFLLSAHIAKLGVDIVVSLGYFSILIAIGTVTLFIVSNMIMARALKKKFTAVVLALKETYVVALCTSSSFAAMPTSLITLKEDFKLSPEGTNLILPLGICLNPWGSTFSRTFLAVFLAQLYGVHLGLKTFPILILGSILTAVAGAGVPAVSSFSLMSIVLAPLGIPTETAAIIILATAPLLSPLLSLTNIAGACATTVWVTRSTKRNLLFGNLDHPSDFNLNFQVTANPVPKDKAETASS